MNNRYVWVTIKDVDDMSNLRGCGVFVPQNIDSYEDLNLYYDLNTLKYYGFDYGDNSSNHRYGKIPLSEMVSILRERKLMRILKDESEDNNL